MSLNGKKNLYPILKQDKNVLIGQNQDERKVILTKREQDIAKKEITIDKREGKFQKRSMICPKSKKI